MMDAANLEWLVRDGSNVIRGPFKHAEILQLIKKGQLKGKSEISRANAYWFSLDEKAEVARFFPELGIKAPEQPTQMTATLTQAADNEQGVEITQFVASPSRSELGKVNPPPAEEKMEWLNDDMAAEFGLGDVEAPSLAMQTRTDLKTEKPKADAIPIAPQELRELPADPPREPSTKEIAQQEMLSRASAKADTLPSELKSATGERPKPISSMLRVPTEKSASGVGAQSQNMVSVPLDLPDAPARIITEDEERAAFSKRAKRNKIIFSVLGVVVASLVGVGIFFVSKNSGTESNSAPKPRETAKSEDRIKKSLLFFNLEAAKEALSDFELQASAKGTVTLPISQAIMKKEFLFDSDGAFMSLQTARSLASTKVEQSEVDNLMSIYRFDRDPEGAVEGFRRLTASDPTDPVFHYNLALAQMRGGHVKEALDSIGPLASAIRSTDPLAEEVNVLVGWAKDSLAKGKDISAETAYAKALDANPQSAKAQLGLAIYHLRKGGIRESEGDFRIFVDGLPDLDPPTRIPNFRKMSDFDFYNYARGELRDLNIPMGAAGTRPSPLVMAADAILSCLQNRTGEAGKILEGALNSAPGDPSLIKALAFSKWKEGKFPEIVDLLKDLQKDRVVFSYGILLGKAYLKMGRKDLSEAQFEALTTQFSQRSDGWSLLGDVRLQMGKTDLAKKNFEMALQKDSQDIVAIRGLDALGMPIPTAILKNLPF